MVYLDDFSYIDLRKSFYNDLEKVANPSASRNTNKYGYFAHRIIQQTIDNWDCETLDSLRFCYKGMHHLSNQSCRQVLENVLNMSIDDRSKDVYIVYRIFFALFCSAARKKVIRLSADVNLFGLFNDASSLYGQFPLRFCFTPIFIELLNVSTPARYKKSKEYHSLDWEKSDVCGVKYKSWNKSTNDLAKFSAAFGIESWQEIDSKRLPMFNAEASALGLGDMSLRPILGFLSIALQRDFIGHYDESKPKSDTRMRKMAVKSINQSKQSVPTSNNPKISHYKALSKLKSAETTGLSPKESHIVFRPVFNNEILNIGGYSVNLEVLKELHPDRLKEETNWKFSQVDFVKSGRAEKNTQKVRVQALKYLNLYLFDYLPYFFENNSTVFSYPETPEKFDRHIFIEQSLVIDRTIRADSKDKIYPISLIEFIARATELQKQSQSKRNNLARDTLARLGRYFEYIRTQLSSINGYKIKANPLEGITTKFGEARARSVKRLMDVTYWINFRIYMKTVSRLVIASACLDLVGYLSALRKHERTTELDNLLLESNKLLDDVKSSCTRAGIDLNQISFNREEIDATKLHLKIVDDNLSTVTISTGKIDLGLVKRRRTTLSSKEISYELPDYQRILNVLISSYAGQRGSNGSWLDTDTFDIKFDPNHSYSESEKVQMYVNTDKVQEDGFYSDIEYGVFELLLFAKRLRGFNSAKSYVEPIFYQLNKSSKFGKIRPLLQLNANNTGLDYSLTDYIKLYESYLRTNNIDLGSNLTLCHSAMRLKEFLSYKKRNIVPPLNDFLIDYFDGDELVRFSPLVLRTELTIHSLRKQLVSVMDVLVSDREAIGISTGQSNIVIGYYSDLPPDQLAKAEKINSISTLFSIVSAGKHDLEQQQSEVEESIIKGTFFDDFRPFSSSAPSGRTNGLTDILYDEKPNIAYNWTHICPCGNTCPDDVIKEVGEKNCHICYKAVMTKFQASAIAATIKNLLDEVKSLKNTLNLSKLKKTDIDHIHYKVKSLSLKASAWHVRWSHIKQNPELMIGNKTKVVDDLTYIDPQHIGNDMLARMIETEDAPLLQSNVLKSRAFKISKSLLSKLYSDELPMPSDDTKYLDLNDPVSFVVQNLRFLSHIKGIDMVKLLEEVELDNSSTNSPLEFLDND